MAGVCKIGLKCVKPNKSVYCASWKFIAGAWLPAITVCNQRIGLSFMHLHVVEQLGTSGLAVTGTATALVTYNIVATAGALAAGTATTLVTYNIVATAGALAAGLAVVGRAYNNVIAASGALAAGTATAQVAHNVVAASGALAAGTADNSVTTFSPLSLSPIVFVDPSVTASLNTSVLGTAGFSAGAASTLNSASTDFNTGAGVSFAWAGWVRWSGDNGSPQVIVSKFAAGNQEWLLYLNYPTTGQLTFVAYGLTSGGTVLTRPGTLTRATWYHVGVWRDAVGGNIYISVNNETPTSASSSFPTGTGTATFRFANTDDNVGALFGGAIGPNGYWNRALTHGSNSDLSALYNGGVPVLYSSLAAGQLSGLVAYYDFDTTAHLTADRTGNGHTLTNNNGVVLTTGFTTTSISDGALVANWLDQGSNGNNFAPPIGNIGPTYKVNIQNGLPMLLADGSTSVLACDSVATALSGASPTYSVFVVVKGVTLNTAYQQIWIAATRPGGTNDPVSELGYNNGTWDYQERNNSAPVLEIGGGTPDANAHVLAVVVDSINDTIYLDGSPIVQHARLGGTTTLTIFSLLAHRNLNTDHVASNTFTGYLGAFGVFTQTDASSLSSLFAYFRRQWATP